MKKYLIILFLYPCLFSAQNNTIDSLKLALKNAKHDTIRCRLISELVELSEDEDVIILNDQMHVIVENNLTNTALNSQLKNEFLKYRAIYLTNEGYIFGQKSEFEKSIENYNKAIQINKSINFDQNTGFILINKGNSLNELGKTVDAIKIIEEAKAMFKIQNNKRGLAFAAITLSEMQNEQGDLVGAIDNSYLGLKLYEELNEKLAIAATLNNLASFLKSQGQYADALKYYQRSLTIIKQFPDKFGLATLLGNIGFVYRKQKNDQKALEYYEKAAEIQLEIDDKKGYANSLNNIASIYESKKNITGALNLYYKALEINTSIKHTKGVLTNEINIGNLRLEMNDVLMAKKLGEKALLTAKSIGNPESIKNSAELLKNVYIKEKNLEKSIEMYDLYISMRDSLKNDSYKKAGIRNMFKYEFEKKSLADSVRTQEEKKVISAQLTAEKTKSYALYGGLALVLVFAGFMYNRFKVTNTQKKIIEIKEQETQKQNLIISEQKHIVEEKHKEITDSINYAERIQRSFIATKEILDENLSDYFVLFKPKDVVSGDFYWASKLNNGNFALVTADSTGHGVPGAIMSLLNITSLEKAIETLNNPSDILNSTRKTIIDRLKKDGSPEGGKDGMDASLCVYDFKNKKLTIAAANNPVWIIRNSGTEVLEVLEVKPDKMPIGKHDKDSISFTQQEIDLQSGDVIYTLTDGFPDQFGGEKGKKFMSKNLRELLATNSHLPMEEQKALLETTFKNWVGNLEQVDDVTLIGVRI
jgi:serine phosphatase RsbU (regulator of sigma subunit)/TPR repeat protein